MLHVSRGPIERDFRLEMGVALAPPNRVALTRIPHDGSDAEAFAVAWEIADDGTGRRIRLRVDARLEIPRFLPLGPIGDELAGGFVAAAARALDLSR